MAQTVKGKAVELARGRPMVDTLPPLQESVVRIDLMSCDRSRCERVGHGSGYFGLHPKTGEVVVLTVFHVAEPQYTLQATLKDGRTFPLRFAVGGPERDMAICSIEEGDGTVACAPAINLDIKTSPKVGYDSFAIGSPMGLNWTTTFGKISAVRDEPWPGQSVKSQLIQLDYSINGGNSGGPIFMVLDPKDSATIATVASVSYGYSPGGGGSIGLNFGVGTPHYAEMFDSIVGTSRLGYLEVARGLHCIDTPRGVMVHRITKGRSTRYDRVVPCSLPTGFVSRWAEKFRRWMLPEELRSAAELSEPVKRFRQNPNRDWSIVDGVKVNGGSWVTVNNLGELQAAMSGVGRSWFRSVELNVRGSVSGKSKTLSA